MADDLQKKIAERCQKIEKNILGDLDEYYSDLSEWQEYSECLVKYGIFYGQALDSALDAALFWGYDLKEFLELYLLPSTTASLDKANFQPHHYSLISKYYLNRALVNLILNNSVCEKSLREASTFHYKYLNEYEYPNDISFINSERETKEAITSVSLPQMIVNKLLAVDYTDVINEFNPSLKTDDEVWLTAWRFAYRLFTYQSLSEVEQSWSDFLHQWKNGFANSCLEGFTINYLVWLYYLYCQESGKRFDIKDLSCQILENKIWKSSTASIG